MLYKVERLLGDVESVEIFARKCWEEVDADVMNDIPLQLDWPLYSAAESAGMIRYYTVWTDAGEKVGMAVFNVAPNLHSKGYFTATSDCLYIEPEHRGCGIELLKLIIEDLREEGVSLFSVNIKSWADKRRNFGRFLGCRLREHVYQRSLL